jgi:hypothetical protein
MNRSVDLSQAPPEAIESQIATTRASLDYKLHELERRLSPKARLADLQARVRPQNYLGAAAVAAIGIGAGLAVAGWRRVKRAGGEVHGVMLDRPVLADVICE